MKVMVMIKATKSSEAGGMPSEEMMVEMGKFNEALMAAGVLVAGEGLHPSGKGKRVRFSGGKPKEVVDGPFDLAGLVAGFWIWEVKSMEEALEWMQRCPDPMPGEDCEVEIRPVYGMEDFGDAMSPELREQEERMRGELEKRRDL